MLSMKFRRRLYALANFSRRICLGIILCRKAESWRMNFWYAAKFHTAGFRLHLKFKASEILRVKISKGEISSRRNFKGENSEDEILDSKI